MQKYFHYVHLDFCRLHKKLCFVVVTYHFVSLCSKEILVKSKKQQKTCIPHI